MTPNMTIDPGKARVIREYAGHPENAGKSMKQIARELDVHDSAVRRALAAPSEESTMTAVAKARPMSRAEAMQSTKAIVAHFKQIEGHVGSIRGLVHELEARRGWEALGYASWRQCVLTEFKSSSASMYRHLEAARIELDVAPDAAIGTIPESQLLPLAKVPQPERREAWDEAVSTAPDGRVTAAHVAETVRSRASLPAPSVSQFEKPDTWSLGHDEAESTPRPDVNDSIEFTPDEVIYARERAGVPTATLPEFAGDDPEPVRPPTDDEWLDTLPARDKLTDTTRPAFDAAALQYRRAFDSEEYRAFRRLVMALDGKQKHDPIKGDFLWRVVSALNLPHPQSWLACGFCDGRGCDKCKRRGHVVS